MLGIDDQRRAQRGFGIGETSLPFPRDTEVQVGLDMVRLFLDHGAEHQSGIVEVTPFEHQEAETIECSGMIGLQRHRPTAFRFNFGWRSVQPSEHIRQIAVDVGVTGNDAQGPTICGFGFDQTIGPLQQNAQVVEDVGILPLRQSPSDQALRDRKLPTLQFQDTEEMEGLRVVPVFGQGDSIGRLGLGEPAGSMSREAGSKRIGHFHLDGSRRSRRCTRPSGGTFILPLRMQPSTAQTPRRDPL